MDPLLVIGQAGILCTVVGASWTVSWKIQRSFAAVLASVDSKLERILNKLEYHERHDDQRFAAINDNLWELRLQNAVREGKVVDQKNKALQDLGGPPSGETRPSFS